MIDPWPVRRSEPAYANRIFQVRTDWCRDPRSQQEHPFWVIESVDWANVVARTTAGEFILVAQWRFAVRAVSIEVPGGMVDPGETPRAAIERELLEETGYAPGRIVELGWVHPNPAILSNRLWLFAAEDCRAVAEHERKPGDAEENIEVRLVKEDELWKLVADGKITHTNVLSGLMRYRLWKSES